MAKPAKNQATAAAVTSERPEPAVPVQASSADKEHKAFTVERVKDGWSMLTVTFKGDKVLRVERTEPDMKSFAIEHFKIAAFKYWGALG